MEERPAQEDWRPILAALANPYTRRIFAQIVLAEDAEAVGSHLSESKRRHALTSLLDAGLVEEADGRLVERTDVFASVLASASRPRRTGAERFLNGRGEIDRYPTDAAERRALLELVAERSLADGEVVTEAELGERLARYGPDTATLRRTMVDEEILERTRSGSEYARVSGD